ncbi:MAG: prenyltransferase [Acidimicrobiales bacterium]
MADTAPPPARPRTGLAARWRSVLRTGNPPAGAVDPITRWLVLTRAAVLPMTLTSAAIAGLLAVGQADFAPGLWVLAAAGLVVAHMANNLMNDLFDLEVGTDTPDYPRALYAPHPVLSGLISRRGLARAALVLNLVDAGVLATLVAARGWVVAAFAGAGFVLSAAYTAPPLRLKRRGLGEPSVLVVWGPLMVGGTYYAAVGHLPWAVVAASLPYALLCTSVLMGKHIDKLAWDGAAGVRTLPVLLGEPAARAVTRGLLGAFYLVTTALVAAGTLPATALVVSVAVGRLRAVWRAFGRPRPERPPQGFPVWPLWFAPLAFLHARRAGTLFVIGLAADALLTA